MMYFSAWVAAYYQHLSCPQGRIYAWANRAWAQGGNFQGQHIKKKSRLKYGMRGKKRLSTREKFKGDLYWKHDVLSFVNFLCWFCLHIPEYGAQNFLGPRGVKYLNMGLPVLMKSIMPYLHLCLWHVFFVPLHWLGINSHWSDTLLIQTKWIRLYTETFEHISSRSAILKLTAWWYIVQCPLLAV
jgi:hypothetical protein